jgi:hypothetical protein
MHATRSRRMALARFFLAGWLACFGVAIGHAQAQFVNPVPPSPPPVFNPSSPNTVPQSPETPVSPGTPSTLPGHEVLTPQSESVPSEAVRSHPRDVTSTPVTTKVAKTRGAPHSPRRHHVSRSRGGEGASGAMVSRAPAVRCPCYFPLYARGNYPPQYGPVCSWHREWDGQWFKDCT